MEVYLDNSATTKVYDEVVQLTSKIMSEDYGNPSSMHQKGVDAEVYVKEAKERIAKTLKVQEKEIFFTSGGTESDNWALMGAASANSRAGRHLITTKIEHPAILQTMEYLESIGYEVTYLPVDEKGVLRLDALEQALWARRPSGTVHHSDKGSQYVSLAYTQRLKEAGLLASTGSTGDSYDNAMAESINGLYKAEVIHRKSWKNRAEVELATLTWVDWYNNRRLLERLGHTPPAEAEKAYYASIGNNDLAA